MIAYGIIKVNGLIHADFLIVYQGTDETIGYNYMQAKKDKIAAEEPYATNWTFDYEVLSTSNKLHGVNIPDVNYLEVIPLDEVSK